MLHKLMDDLLTACATGAGYEDAAAAIRAEVAEVNGNTVKTVDGSTWTVTASK